MRDCSILDNSYSLGIAANGAEKYSSPLAVVQHPNTQIRTGPEPNRVLPAQNYWFGVDDIGALPEEFVGNCFFFFCRKVHLAAGNLDAQIENIEYNLAQMFAAKLYPNYVSFSRACLMETVSLNLTYGRAVVMLAAELAMY